MDTTESKRGSGWIGFILGALIAGVICLTLGVLYGNLEAYHNRFVRESVIANKILAGRREYSGISLNHSSEGELGFEGTVPTKMALEELTAAVAERFGHEDLEARMGGVEVANSKDATDKN